MVNRSSLSIHIVQRSRLRVLYNLLTYSKLLVFTFLLAISHAKAIVLDGVVDFQMNFAKGKWARFERLDKVKKKDFTENRP